MVNLGELLLSCKNKIDYEDMHIISEFVETYEFDDVLKIDNSEETNSINKKDRDSEEENSDVQKNDNTKLNKKMNYSLFPKDIDSHMNFSINGYNEEKIKERKKKKEEEDGEKNDKCEDSKLTHAFNFGTGEDFNNSQINKCNELPVFLKDIFDNFNNLYYVGVMKKCSFLHSILYISEIMYMSYPTSTKDTFIDSVFIKLYDSLNDYYSVKNYRKDGYIKEKMFKSLISSVKIIDRPLQRYIADYFQLNVIVIEPRYKKYYKCSQTNSDFVTIFLLKEGDIYQPVLSDKGDHYFNDMEDKLDEHLTEEIKEERKIKEISYNSAEEKQSKIRLLKKMKIAEVIEVAEKLEIQIMNDLTSRKKKKDDLIAEIIACM